MRAHASILLAALCGGTWGWWTPGSTGAAHLPARRGCGDAAGVSWEPASPRQGALFRVVVSGAVPSEVTGLVAGEPLHFAAREGMSSGAEAFAAVPVDQVGDLQINVECAAPGGVDTIVATLTAAAGEYPIERLTVAPAFGSPPAPAVAARIRRESERAVAVARRSHRTPRLWRESFVEPRTSRITSGFGGGREFNGTITSRHLGTDFAGATGAPVRAVNRGVVRIVDRFYLGGRVVYIDHGTGLTSAYLHLSRQSIAVGDTVERGQVIGQVGATGRVTGPHLHLIVRYGSITIDPMSLFAIAGDDSTRR